MAKIVSCAVVKTLVLRSIGFIVVITACRYSARAPNGSICTSTITFYLASISKSTFRRQRQR